jgi:hypothetical protein
MSSSFVAAQATYRRPVRSSAARTAIRWRKRPQGFPRTDPRNHCRRHPRKWRFSGSRTRTHAPRCAEVVRRTASAGPTHVQTKLARQREELGQLCDTAIGRYLAAVVAVTTAAVAHGSDVLAAVDQKPFVLTVDDHSPDPAYPKTGIRDVDREIAAAHRAAHKGRKQQRDRGRRSPQPALPCWPGGRRRTRLCRSLSPTGQGWPARPPTPPARRRTVQRTVRHTDNRAPRPHARWCSGNPAHVGRSATSAQLSSARPHQAG